MSSHHIVRDDQEPALIINEAIDNLEHVQQLLEWSPTVISSQDALPWLIKNQIKVDVVICKNEDQKNIFQLLEFQQPVKILGFEALESSIISEAISFLGYSKYPAAHIIGPISKDSMMTITNYTSLNLNWSDGDNMWSLFKSGRFSKWLKEKHELQLAGSSLQIKGDFEKVDDQKIITASAGIIEITSPEVFWIGERL
ncbi:hypothetical protein [Fulvivirga ligni]|uniref:hypothetical protein n=1 Tax=Fulvivirga ligni TaxID=2904246 RepID=UPI001F35166E|nr:hypothetical protein [Fulvivirga ligni]UII22631.1 hypothetical protein LVD16_05250 [Fulvivirga ligni]